MMNKEGFEMTKVLFVCLGNICRSPMAEGMFRKMIKDQGLDDKIYVESRATSSYEIGNPPHIGTKNILDRLDIDYHNKKAQKISASDFENFDYIIGMDHQNVTDLKKHGAKYIDKIHLIRDIDPHTKGQIVPDPYYDASHHQTFEILSQTLPLWLEEIKRNI